MAAEHVHDEGLVVVAWGQSVVVGSAGNLYSLRNVPGNTGHKDVDILFYNLSVFERKQARL